MDIRTKAAAPTGKLHLRDANDELMYDEATKAPVCVNVFGPASKQHAKANAARQAKIFDSIKRKGKTEVSPERKASDDAEFLADITESFENLSYDNLTGRALAEAVYKDTSIGFIADQVAEYVREWSNFSTPSATI